MYKFYGPHKTCTSTVSLKFTHFRYWRPFSRQITSKCFRICVSEIFPKTIPECLRKIGRKSTKSDDLPVTIVFKERAWTSVEGYWKASRQKRGWFRLPPGTEMLCMNNELSDLRLTFNLFSTWFILNPSTITWVDWKHRSSKNYTDLHCTGDDLIDLSPAISVPCGWNLSVQRRRTGFQCMDLICIAVSDIQWTLLFSVLQLQPFLHRLTSTQIRARKPLCRCHNITQYKGSGPGFEGKNTAGLWESALTHV